MRRTLGADPSDDELLQVYGDWLEESGYPAEGEMMALERKLALENGAVHGRLRVVASFTDPAWRMLVARAAIEGEHEPSCSGRWDLLVPSEHPAVRHCARCDRPVYFVDSIEDAQEYAALARLVVRDPALLR